MYENCTLLDIKAQADIAFPVNYLSLKGGTLLFHETVLPSIVIILFMNVIIIIILLMLLLLYYKRFQNSNLHFDCTTTFH